jgi:Sulfotransferase domain
MMQRLIRLAKRALGLHHPGRNLDVLPDDVFILSFPKSGNTWTRFLIANLIYPETPADFSNINRLIPDPEAMSKRDLAKMPRPRIIKSHQYFDPRYPRIIFIVRDPRDVLLSTYHFQRKRRVIDDHYPLKEYAGQFIAGKTSPYGSWGDNVASWLVTRQGRPGFLLLRYEDMLDDAARELNKVAAFLQIPPDAERIATAVRRSAADEMRKLEKSQAHLWSTTKSTRQDVPFVRAAKAGGWRTELPEEATSQLEAAWGHLMTHLGYELLVPAGKTNVDSGLLETILNGPSR